MPPVQIELNGCVRQDSDEEDEEDDADEEDEGGRGRRGGRDGRRRRKGTTNTKGMMNMICFFNPRFDLVVTVQNAPHSHLLMLAMPRPACRQDRYRESYQPDSTEKSGRLRPLPRRCHPSAKVITKFLLALPQLAESPLSPCTSPAGRYEPRYEPRYTAVTRCPLSL